VRFFYEVSVVQGRDEFVQVSSWTKTERRNDEKTYPLFIESLISLSHFRTTVLATPSTACCKLYVDATTVEIGMVKLESGLERGSVREFEKRAAFRPDFACFGSGLLFPFRRVQREKPYSRGMRA
jgi:hypothetical protein